MRFEEIIRIMDEMREAFNESEEAGLSYREEHNDEISAMLNENYSFLNMCAKIEAQDDENYKDVVFSNEEKTVAIMSHETYQNLLNTLTGLLEERNGKSEVEEVEEMVVKD